MNFNNYNRMQSLKRKPNIAPRLDKDCIGPCNSNMVKLGLCKCEKKPVKKNKKNPFFEYRFWITVMILMMIASFMFHINIGTGLLIILLTWVYFQFFKK